MWKTLTAKLFFVLARVFLGRGMLIGQWFQNKGILLLTGMKENND
jgi:hypothetical protein